MEAVEIVERRLCTQRLIGTPFASATEVVRGLGAVQSQEFDQAVWALAQRSGHPTAEEVIRAFDAGEILRTHVLRPTWHFVLPEDIGWMLRLTSSRIRAQMHSAFRLTELDDALLARCADLLTSALAESGAMTRAELRDVLERACIETTAGRGGFVTLHLELEGLVCSGPLKDGKQTYALLADRAKRGRDLEGDEALAELAERYFASHGPATVADFAWWGALTLRQARRALELCGDRFEEVGELDGLAYLADPATVDAERIDGALMLGSFDEATVAYKGLRTVSVAGEPGRTLPLGPILVGGRWIGSWKRRRDPSVAPIAAPLFSPIDARAETALRAEAERLGAHLGLPIELETLEGEPLAAA